MNPTPSWFSPTENPLAARWHGDLVAVDPSVRSPGIALFRFGKLVACGRARIAEALHELPEGERWLRVAGELFAWWDEQRDGATHTIRTVVYERPRILSESRGKSKGDPNQLLGLVGTGQSFATMITMHNLHNGVRPPELLTPVPDEWTGQLPKTVTAIVKGRRVQKIPKDPWSSPRGIWIRGVLEPAELPFAPAQHDAIDSIGIGLHALGRLKVRRVFAGAT